MMCLFNYRLTQSMSQNVHFFSVRNWPACELHFETLTNGVEHLAGMLEDVLGSAFDLFAFLNLRH